MVYEDEVQLQSLVSDTTTRPRESTMHKNIKTEARECQQVLWTEETTFEIFGSGWRKFVDPRAGEQHNVNVKCLQTTVRGGKRWKI